MIIRIIQNLGSIGSAAALLLLVVTPASAQETQGTIQLEQGSTSPLPSAELPPIVIESSRLPNSGAGVSPTGANVYTTTQGDIQNLPAGENTPVSDILTQMPGVAIDQNQQIHIRNTEGPQFQYNINGIMVPFDINTNPPFLNMFNATVVSRLDLITGILPSRYSYATGGVVDIETKDGCDNPGGQASLTFGQRTVLQPSIQDAGCDGKLSYYVSMLYDQGQTAFSSATPSPNPIHDFTNQGQGFASFSYPLTDITKLSVILSSAGSNNQLPNVPNLPQQFTLAGANNAMNSSSINSYLNFRDDLAIVTLKSTPSADLSWQIAYAAHYISQEFKPDNAGELIFQGVASTASHDDLDNTLQGDLTYKTGNHTLGAGFYLGEYRVIADDTSLVFPADANGNQISTTPITVVNNAHATNIVSGIYVDDLWQIDDRLKLNTGLRWDVLTGFTNNNQFDPTINLSWLATPDTTLHGGVARYMQIPSFQGISPTASAAFAGTTAAGPNGVSTPLTEDDYEVDAGVVHHLTPEITLAEDNYYELTRHYLDTGQFGVVPIFAPFNYDHGFIWGSEASISYKTDKFSAYANATLGRNLQKGVVTGQFNFPADELAFIDGHYIVLDHQPLIGASAGASYKLGPWTFNLDGVYSSGLRADFADLQKLPDVIQLNAGIERDFNIPGIGKITDRITALNLLNRINLIRPAEGIGIFQAAYGPRLTLLNTVTIPF
ncbi:MAG TPA: TonB-dependent receptor [Stellaceae bacterium]|nr:TonB-dependent receptor [Stellaceae bacterium]